VLARAEGNPLYAEEYVRMLQDRGFLVRGERGWQLEAGADLPLPETVQGMIAARLDALSPAQKELVQDAAVVGKVFWPGALSAIGKGSVSTLEESLHALERKEFVRRERRSAVAGETQYAFHHLLVRDVAYGQIPRALRVDKHRFAAEWIQSLAGDRSEDHAEMLAHHYLEALSLARAAGVDLTPLREPAEAALVEAAERATALNSWRAALDYATSALELMDAGNPLRPRVTFALVRAKAFLAEFDVDLALAVRDALVERGEIELAAEAEVLISDVLWERGEAADSDVHGARAVALVEQRPASYSKAIAYAQRARYLLLAGAEQEALVLARKALDIAEGLGRDDLLSHVSNTIGMSKITAGDLGGFADLEKSVELGEAANAPDQIHRAYNNLANMYWYVGRLDAATAALARGREVGERFGNARGLEWLDGEDMFDMFIRGDWDGALRLADKLLRAAANRPSYLEGSARRVTSDIVLARGDLERALEESRRGLEQGREIRDAQAITPALLGHTQVLVAAGRQAEADVLLAELLGGYELSPAWLHYLPLLLCELGRGQEYLAATEGERLPTPWIEAGRAAASGDFARAIELYEAIGARPAEARVRVLAAEALVGDGRSAEAHTTLQPALAFYRGVGAKAYVSRAEALLAASA
ncbi:MAG: hypothetical protein M3540_01240, partial [Actinomycetota bacterium]|nr:hypothetical protein [Actinomycetota bacterium]